MNGYLYECVISGACNPSVTTNGVTLNTYALPGVSTPSNNGVCQGTTTTFSVTGSGANISYQWQLAGSNLSNNSIYSGVTTNTLTITGPVVAMNGNQYRCIVSSSSCSPAATSPYATLNVYTAPAITSQPLSPTVCPNSTVNYSVTATGSALTYQWYENGNAISNGGIYGGATSNTLTLTGVIPSMAFNAYTCVVSGTCPPTLTSSIGYLYFSTTPAIALSGQPQNSSVCQGQNDSFTVIATGAGLSYQWQVNTGSGYSNVSNNITYSGYSGITGPTLKLNGVTPAMNSYTYQCIVSGTCLPSVTSNAALLTVNTNPAISPGGQPSNSTICAGGTTNFGVTATGPGLVYQWFVNTGTGYSSVPNGGVYSGATTSTLTITGAPSFMSGYHYKCNITGICGPTDTSGAALLVVDTLPTINTQPVNTHVCVNNNTSLSISATGTNISYQWMVNSGAGFANITNNSTYSGATTNTLGISTAGLAMNGYQYMCVVSGTCTPAANSTIVSLQVYTPPSILVQPTSDTVCSGALASFNVGATGSVLTYQWQVNTGSGFANITNVGPYNGATTSILMVAPTSPVMNGNTYRCIISGACTPTVTSSAVPLVIYNLPYVTNVTGSSTICNGGNTSFTVQGQGTGISFQWMVNMGSGFVPITNSSLYSGANSATLSLTGASNNMGGYLYECIVSGTCLPRATSIPDTLNFHPTPSTAFTASGPLTFCAGDSVTLSIPGGNSYQWALNGNNISAATNSSYTAHVMGNYTVQATSSFGCIGISGISYVTVNPLPSAPINTILGNLTFCDGDSVVFGSNTDPGALHEWYRDSIPVANTNTYTAKTAGTYNVTVGENGCMNTSSSLIVVVNPVAVDSLMSNNSLPVICANGNGVTLSAITISGQTYTTFQWMQNGFVINGATAPQYTATAGGWYSVAITNNYGCTINTNLTYLQLVQPPAPVITEQGSTLYANGFTNATYKWYLNGNPISGATSNSLHVTQNGTYTVSVTDSNLCSATSPAFYLTNVGVVNVTVTGDEVKIYPNPATSVVNIDAPASVNVAIMSLDGKMVLSQNNAKALDISHLANGVYMIQVYDANNVLVKTEKLVKNNW